MTEDPRITTLDKFDTRQIKTADIYKGTFSTWW
jgi:hypothetical protein